jgi:hypothetical protein
MRKVARTRSRPVHTQAPAPRHLDFFNLMAWFSAIVLLWGIIGIIFFLIYSS